jgi:hypothetical protein
VLYYSTSTTFHLIIFSYISEAAASLLDERLKLYIVPRTELASLSSPVSQLYITDGKELTCVKAFYYDWLDRNAAKKGKPLPDKIGSMQYFLHGYTGKCFECVSRRSKIDSLSVRRFRVPAQTPMARACNIRYV